MDSTKPTLVKIVKLGDKYHYPEYEILEDNSGKYFGVDPDNPANVTEEEQDTGYCYRDGVEYRYIDYDWMHFVGTAADYENWNQSTCDKLEEIRDRLYVGAVIEVETRYLGGDMYANAIALRDG